MLNLDPQVEMDGQSAFSEEVQRRDELRMLIRNSFEELRIPASSSSAERDAVVARNQRLLGSGADGPERIFRIGPNQELLGEPASAAGEQLDVELAYAVRLRGRRPGVGFVPVHVVARVEGGGEAGRDVAVAVNGTIVGVGKHLHARQRATRASSCR